MCSGFDAGSYLRLIDFAYHSTLGLEVIKKKRECDEKHVLVAIGESDENQMVRLIPLEPPVADHLTTKFLEANCLRRNC